MANEVTTTSATEFVATEVIERVIYDAAYDAGKILPFVRFVDISAAPTNTAELPKWPLLSATDLTEGTDMTNSAVNPTSVTCAADEAGLMITLTDMLVNADIHGGVEAYAAQLGAAVGTKIESDLAAEFADFSNSVGTTTVNLTETQFLEAIYLLEAGVAQGDIMAFMHPIQIHDLRVDIATSAGAVWGASAGPNALVTRMGSFYGVPTIGSTQCALVAADADRQGAMMPVGERCGIVYVNKRPIYVEPERDASKRGTELVCAAVYGDECANTAANGGIKIVSDA